MATKELSGKKILLVEDEQVTADREVTELKKKGYDVVHASTGKEALRLVETGDFDLVLMDVELGDGPDGTEIAKEILKDTEIPILFLSSHKGAEIVEKTGKVSSYGYVVKDSGIAVIDMSIKMAFRLYEEKKFTQQAIDSLIDTFFLFDPATGKALRWNQAFNEISGYSNEEIKRLPAPQSYYSPDDLSKAVAFLDRVKKEGSGSIELDLICKDGKKIATEYTVSSVRGKEKEPEVYISIGRDVRDRRKFEEELIKREEYHKALFELNKAVKLIIDPETGQILDVNSAASAFYGYSKEELQNLMIMDINILSNEEVRQEMERAKQTEKLCFDFKHKLANGEVRDVEVYSGPVKMDEKTVLYSIVHDVTERKKAEKILEETSQKNALLLKELQHRAKNSFNMISSMMALAEDATVTEGEKARLRETGNRIKAISEMYELLYSSDSVEEVRLDEYFEKICVSLLNISSGVQLLWDLKPLTVPVRKAIPLGITVAELITNAFKHAFSDRQQGNILMTLKSAGEEIMITVKDDGRALPDDTDFERSETLGLRLVDALVEQVDGTLSMERKSGTAIEILIPENESTSKE